MLSLFKIKPHPNLCKLYKDTPSNVLTFEAEFLPTLCPPRPWISVDSGGYAFLKTDFVRTPYYAVRLLLQTNSIFFLHQID